MPATPRHPLLPRRWARSLLAAALSLSAPFAPTRAPELRPEISFRDASAAQVATVEWGLVLFEEAGLPLPPLEVVGHRTTEPCQGRPAFHRPRGRRSRIDLCWHREGEALELLVLHELAHAWDHHGLTPARREAFLRLRGLTGWRDDDLDRWHVMGAEHAAEIVKWGVIDRPVRLAQIDRNSCDELLAGYRVLTGTDPVHGLTEACLADSP